MEAAEWMEAVAVGAVTATVAMEEDLAVAMDLAVVGKAMLAMATASSCTAAT